MIYTGLLVFARYAAPVGQSIDCFLPATGAGGGISFPRNLCQWSSMHKGYGCFLVSAGSWVCEYSFVLLLAVGVLGKTEAGNQESKFHCSEVISSQPYI